MEPNEIIISVLVVIVATRAASVMVICLSSRPLPGHFAGGNRLVSDGLNAVLGVLRNWAYALQAASHHLLAQIQYNVRLKVIDPASKFFPGSCHNLAMLPTAYSGALRAVRASLMLLLLLAGCASQQPQQASEPAKTPDYSAPCSQEGMASWYRGSWRDRASPHDLVAAHRSLPFGTSVHVTDIDTGQSIVVRINDRGPFIQGRIIDLSRAAADQLGIRDDGLALVRLEPLSSTGRGCPLQQAQLNQ
jgi:rare lipoprotein A